MLPTSDIGQAAAPVAVRPRRHVLPGLPLTLTWTVAWLGALVLIPFAALFAKAFSEPWAHFWEAVTSARVLAAYGVTFGLSLLAALTNAVFGLVIAWVLVRYTFPGRRLLDALVDLPFALPTAVAGLALTTLFAPQGWLGAPLAEAFGLQVVYTRLGIYIALVFIGLPFVVRTLQPVIADLSADVEEAAACLGATRWTTFRRVIFPALVPPLLTGAVLAFGRAVGEYGSVIFIAGNLPYRTEIVPLLIVVKLEQYDYAGAAAIGVVLVAASVLILLGVHLLQRWHARHTGGRG